MNRTKFPRTPHLPFSEGIADDDRRLDNCDHFIGKEVIVSEKLDGENTTIYYDGVCHARSLDSRHHPSRSWVKQLASRLIGELPGHRICGENLFAYHSIFYTRLPSYFFVIGIYTEQNVCLPWEETEEACEILGLKTVPVIYRGPWDEFRIRNLWSGNGAYPTFEAEKPNPVFPQDFRPCSAEGYVVRLADAFSYDRFEMSVAKYVRQNHVRTSAHWMESEVVQNLLEA